MVSLKTPPTSTITDTVKIAQHKYSMTVIKPAFKSIKLSLWNYWKNPTNEKHAALSKANYFKIASFPLNSAINSELIIKAQKTERGGGSFLKLPCDSVARTENQSPKGYMNDISSVIVKVTV